MTVKTMPAPAAKRPAGRPRNPDVDRAILTAAIDVLEEVGLQGMTVSAVAERAGVARATVYLRWPTREALLGGMARAAGGGLPYPLTGDLARDYRRGAEFAREVVSGEHFIALLPELVGAVLANPQQISFEAIAPNRVRLAAEFAAMAAAQGFDPTFDPSLGFDAILGAELIYILANGKPPTARYSRQLGEMIVAGLRAQAATTET